MSDKEMNLAILNKLYEIADKVFNEGVNVKEGNYTASDLAKMKDSAFKDGYLETENKKVYDYSAQKIVEKDCFIAPMASVNVLSFVCSFCVVQVDGTNELLIINDSFLKDTIILDIHQIMFIETNFKH